MIQYIMVKLVRLVGSDSDIIRNYFDSGISLSAHSKIALQNLAVEFNDDLVREFFVIDANTNTFDLTAENQTVTINLDYTGSEQEYTLDELLTEITNKCNFTPNNGQYLDYEAGLHGDHFQLYGQLADLSLGNISTAWRITKGDVGVGGSVNVGSVITGPLTTDFNIVSKYVAPRVSNTMRFRLPNVATNRATCQFSFGLVDANDATETILLGGEVFDTGAAVRMRTIVNGGVDQTGVVNILNNYYLQFFYDGNGQSRLVQFNTGGVAVQETINLPQQSDTFMSRSVRWVLKFPNGSNISVGQGAAGNAIQNTVLSTVATAEELTTSVFNSTISIPANSRLRKYLGFPNGTGSNRGDPAVIIAKGEIDGDSQLAGILVTLNRGILDSYDGESGKTANILAVINEFSKNKSGVSYSTDYPVKIPLKNATDINMQDLSVSFLNQATTMTANSRPLQFSGKAVVTLLLYDEGEG